MFTTTGYTRRILDDELDELLPGLSAVALEGAKGVGKTATALQRARSVYILDDPSVREIVEADMDRVITADGPVLIDEWQQLPAIWDRVRRAVDAGAPTGRFLLTGSASPRGTGTHSGAGRIVSLRMRPLALAERHPGEATVSLGEMLQSTGAAIGGSTTWGLDSYVDEILRSGYPAIHPLEGRVRRAQLDAYLLRVVDRDFPELGQELRNPSALRRWMTAYAAATATTTAFERIRDAAGSVNARPPARTTVQPYRDVLERLFILDEVPGWLPTRNRIARLTSPSKHHLADPALAARLLGIRDQHALLEATAATPFAPRDGALLGRLFESLVTQSVRVYAQANEAHVGHLRTQSGAREIDLIVDRGDERVVAIEVKLSTTVHGETVKHLNWLADELGDDLLDRVVITTGNEAYRRSDGIAVIPAALLGP